MQDLLTPLLTPKQAGAYLGIQYETLAVWRTTGRYNLPFVKVGRAVRYRLSDLEAWVKDRIQTQIQTQNG